MVWFFSTLLFGLMHLPNWVFGAGPAATAQVAFTFGAGTILYLTRRLTGSLIFAMALHGIWDFSSFWGEPALLTSAFPFINFIAALVLVYFLLRKDKGVHLPQAGESKPESLPVAS
jgi:membrane protease YdiL (CAAX protease family)